MRIMPFTATCLISKNLQRPADGASDCIIVQKNASGTPPKTRPRQSAGALTESAFRSNLIWVGTSRHSICHAATGTTLTRATGE